MLHFILWIFQQIMNMKIERGEQIFIKFSKEFLLSNFSLSS